MDMPVNMLSPVVLSVISVIYGFSDCSALFNTILSPGVKVRAPLYRPEKD